MDGKLKTRTKQLDGRNLNQNSTLEMLNLRCLIDIKQKESPEMSLLLNKSLTHLLPQVSFIIEHVFTAANK